MIAIFGQCGYSAIAYDQAIEARAFGSSKRYKFWRYKDKSVYRYRGFFGTKSRIEFDPSEKMDNAVITLDRPEGWEISTADNMLYFMPVDPSTAQTLMTVVTANRSYAFELNAEEPDGPLDERITIAYYFEYPPQTVSTPGGAITEGETVILKYVKNRGPDLSKHEDYSYNIKVSGDNSIKPVAAFHDGERTWLRLRDQDPEASTIFAVDKNGYEELVNFSIEGGYIVVDGIHKILTMRNGSDIACVFNEDVK